MNANKVGNIIAGLRKEAGLTQQSLAEALCVTDKAVSKWERGKCLPELTIIKRISTFFNTDIEYLIADGGPSLLNGWVGEIYAENVDIVLHGQPILNYLLSYLMLMGISNIYVKDNKNVQHDKIGLRFNDHPFSEDYNKCIIYKPFLLVGANFTRQLHSCMLSESLHVTPCLNKKSLPMVFQKKKTWRQPVSTQKVLEDKELNRGMIFVPLDSKEGLLDAERFLTIYEKYSGTVIGDLAEIGKLRGLN